MLTSSLMYLLISLAIRGSAEALKAASKLLAEKRPVASKWLSILADIVGAFGYGKPNLGVSPTK